MFYSRQFWQASLEFRASKFFHFLICSLFYFNFLLNSQNNGSLSPISLRLKETPKLNGLVSILISVLDSSSLSSQFNKSYFIRPLLRYDWSLCKVFSCPTESWNTLKANKTKIKILWNFFLKKIKFFWNKSTLIGCHLINS